MKKIVVAIDSFKGSLTTFEAGRAIAEALKEVYENAEVRISPIADGEKVRLKQSYPQPMENL